MKITLAIDAMGGDKAPDMVIEGLIVLTTRYPDVHFLIFGDEALISPLMAGQDKLKSRSTLIHTDEVVPSSMKPSTAVRSLPNSSMRLAIKSVAEGKADGVVSAGNTGAYLALAKLIIKTLPGIDRPALASLIPTMRNEAVMLDLGANLECSPQNLLQFAIMGEKFTRHVLNHPKPSVGLLNVGTEENKGHPTVQAACDLIKNSSIAGHFHGYIEGDDITKGTVDVIVTDGFTGNAVLKAGEGTMSLALSFFKQAFASSLLAKIGYVFARPALKRLSKRLDYRSYNGGIWLGLNGIAVKSHGGADALGFAHSVDLAVDMVRSKMNDHISKEFSHMPQEKTPNPKVTQDRKDPHLNPQVA